MAIKVVKDNTIYKYSCNSCGSLLEFNRRDVISTTKYLKIYNYIEQCPSCKKRIVLPSNLNEIKE